MNTAMKSSHQFGRFYLSHPCILAVVLCWILGSYQPAYPAPRKVVDRIVAVVNDDIIVLQELNELLAPYEAQMEVSGYSAEKQKDMLYDVRQTLLEQLINQKLIEQVANTSQLTIEEKDIDSSIERIKEGNRFTDEDFREALESQGLTMESYRKRIRSQILASRLETLEVKRKIVITKDEIKAYYEQNASKYAGETKYHLRNIVKRVPNFGEAEEKQAVYETMQAVIKEFNNGTPFETLAAAHSESPYADEGGELGVFKLSDLSANLRHAIENLSAGQITPILQTSQGYQIIYLQEIINSPGVSLEAATREIEELLYEEQYKQKKKEWIDHLRERAHIKVIQ